MSKPETIKQRAKRVAKEFRAGRGRAWPWIGPTEWIVDAECMDQIRTASYVGGTMTVDEIMEFRAEFLTEITKLGYL